MDSDLGETGLRDGDYGGLGNSLRHTEPQVDWGGHARLFDQLARLGQVKGVEVQRGVLECLRRRSDHERCRWFRVPEQAGLDDARTVDRERDGLPDLLVVQRGL